MVMGLPVRSNFKVTGIAIVLCISLSACSSSKSLAGINLTCASVESYQSTRALALTSAARGENTVDSVNTMIEGLRPGIKGDLEASKIFDSYLAAMREWASSVDEYQITKQVESLRVAGTKLEGQIDLLVPKCGSNGWKFDSGWRG